MGTSFVGYSDNGFWMHDSILELWLRFAALHIEDQVEDQSEIHSIRNEWLLASRGYFNGAVALNLMKNISTPIGKAAVLKAIRSLASSLKSGPKALDKDTINLLGFSSNYLENIEVSRLIEVCDCFEALIAGKRFGPSSETKIMPGSSHRK
ncbi:MAG: hypothetical protein VX447_03340 [Pseudomonadota bacterium]|uniref:hypothetical protein n=1 Tax=Gallaecimonas pentaromativorans TaxID=584787 RepID=UPI0012ECC6D3|nr:hypothetical protein [Gallaecimonas pentaromativorans]MED5523772.1 hypothetical protein [Pseudomonadota bacterium]